MFMQDEMYSGYVDKFFASHSYSGLSWIQDFDQKRYGDASISLLNESKVAVDLETKHVSFLANSPGYMMLTTFDS